MRSLQPVIWSKGTFLTPQHLQAHDRFLENGLHFRLHALQYCPWGFSTLQIDREALASGQLSIQSAQGLFPDGLAFEIPNADAPPPPKILNQYLDGDQTSITVHLAIPPHVEGGLNVSMGKRGMDSRYLSELTMVRDENTGQSEKPIQVARKNFRLLVDGEAREGTPVLGVARIRRGAGGVFQLDPGYVPPLLNLAASDYLPTILRRLVEILVARSSMLAGLRRQKNQGLADFTSSDIANFWLLYTVNSYLPLLRHVLEGKQGHPEALYTTMIALAGALSTFSRQIQPGDLPQYEHDDLGKCFSGLDEKIRQMLETAVPTNVVSLPLKLVQPSIYATALAEDRYLVNTKMYLAVKASMPEADLIQRTPQLMKVCSATHIEHLIRQALPGVSMIHTSTPPNSIPLKLDYQYFSLNQAGSAWESVTRARNFAVYAPAEFPEPQFELLILLPFNS